MNRIASRVLLALAGIALLLFAMAIVIVAVAEWNYRSAAGHPNPVPLPSDAVTGDAGKPVLILLHGAGLNSHMWDAVRRHIDPAFRVIALDLPGHGTHRDEAYSLEGATATVAAAARAVAPAPVLLVGDSLGGYTAIAAASALPPSQLRGLVLAGSSSNFEGAMQWPRYVKDIVMITLLSAVVDEADFGARALGRFGVAEADRPAIVAAGVSLRSVPQAGRALIGVDMRGKLAAIDAPVLIVNGALDERAVAQEASFVAAARRATQYRFENTGHGVSMIRPAEFARVVNDFARQQVAVPGASASAPAAHTVVEPAQARESHS